MLANILSAEEWKCMACNLKQARKHRAEYYVAAKHLRNLVAPERTP